MNLILAVFGYAFMNTFLVSRLVPPYIMGGQGHPNNETENETQQNRRKRNQDDFERQKKNSIKRRRVIQITEKELPNS